MKHTVEQFLKLETRVWNAMKAGDMEMDARLLTDDFLGVYQTGIAGKLEHCQQLENGPTVASYEIREPRILVLSENSVLLSYLATWTRMSSANAGDIETMYVSSIWRNSDGGWRNVFSQDTPVGG
ncbi:MAG: nuclear transport factor 2 family protein [Candidatus Marinimicrobia bacterium]|nr:nuclear transport factor 2 family protein [Candidatus Neomarinimicrobiota bacterium]